MTDKSLDVYLNGSRDYVQGTQILARSAEMLPHPPYVLRQAIFSTITDQLVAIVGTEAAGAPAQNIIGKASFENDAGKAVPVTWVALEQPAPRTEIPAPSEWHRRDVGSDHPLSGQFDLSGLDTGEAFLVALIQTIKSLHESLAKDVSDVWFTGLRRADIPMSNFPDTEGVLNITFDRMMGRDGEFQSIQRTIFKGNKGASVQAVITFAFKSKDFSHVH